MATPPQQDSAHNSPTSPEPTAPKSVRIFVGDVPVLDESDDPDLTLTVTRPDTLGTILRMEDITEPGSSPRSPQPLGALSAAERFTVHGVVAAGGCGIVKSATQSSLGRIVAVKVIRPDLLSLDGNDSAVRAMTQHMFHVEAVTTALLEHPNIVPVYDYGTDAAGAPMIAMKLVKGESWDVVLTRDFQSLEPDDYLAKHLPYFIAMMQAVAFAHSRNVVHRDLKPNQVMIGEFGEVLLMDWGLAISLDSGNQDAIEPQSNLATAETATSPSGTPSYMAPEQTLPTAGKVSFHTDIYLLGGTLYYILTNRPPRRASKSAETMALAAQGFVTPLEQAAPGRPIPPELEKLVRQCLEIDPANRPAAVVEMVAEIQSYLSGASSRSTAVEIVTHVEQMFSQLQSPADDSDTDHRGSTADLYAKCSDFLSQLDRATILWPRNPRAARLRCDILALYSETALRHDDLMLARGLAGLIDPPDLRASLTSRIDMRSLQLQRERRQQRILRASFVVVTALFVCFSVYHIVSQRRANKLIAEQRDSADAARQSAERAEQHATHLQRKAEEQQYFSTIAAVDSAIARYHREQAAKLLLSGTPPYLRAWEWGFAADRLFGHHFTLTPQQFLASASLSPDGKWLYSGSRDGAVHVFDTTNGRYDRIFPYFGGRLCEAIVSHDGTKLLLPSYERYGVICEADSGRPLHYLIGHASLLRSGAWSPDDQYAATTCLDKTIRVWNVTTGNTTVLLDKFASAPYICRFGESSNTLIVGCDDGSASIYDLTTGKVALALQGGTRAITDLTISPDHNTILTCSQDGILRFIDARTGAVSRLINYADTFPAAACFLRNGAYVAVAVDNGELQVLDANTAKVVSTELGVQAANQIVASPNGERLYLSGRFHIHAYDLDQLLLQSISSPIPPGRTAAPESYDVVIPVFGLTAGREPTWNSKEKVWNTTAGRTIIQLGSRTVAVDSRYSTISPDGRVRFDIDPKTLLGVATNLETNQIVFRAGSEKLQESHFSPDGKYLAIVNPRNKISIVDTVSWRVTNVLAANDNTSSTSALDLYNCAASAFTPNSDSLVVAYLNGSIISWNVATGKAMWESERTSGVGVSVDFNHSGTQFLVGGNDDRITMWDARTGKLIQSLLGHDRAVIGAAFSPDDTRIVSFGRGSIVRIWEAQTGREIISNNVGSLDNLVLGARFTKDGRSVMLAMQDGTVKAMNSLPWDPKTYDDSSLTSMTDSIRMELFSRRQVLGSHITVSDVLAEPRVVPRPPPPIIKP